MLRTVKNLEKFKWPENFTITLSHNEDSNFAIFSNLLYLNKVISYVMQ